MTTKDAKDRGQIPTWKEQMDAIRARQEAKEARWAAIGYRRPIGFSNDH